MLKDGKFVEAACGRPGRPSNDNSVAVARRVAAVQEMYIGQARFRHPWDRVEFPISAYGIDPRGPMMDLPGLAERAAELTLPDRALFDGLSRTTHGPVAAAVRGAGSLTTEVNFRAVTLIGTIPVGVSINTDGNLFLSPANFHRLFPGRDPGAVDLGLVRLHPGADPAATRDALAALLGREARVMTRGQLVDAEVRFVTADPADVFA